MGVGELGLGFKVGFLVWWVFIKEWNFSAIRVSVGDKLTVVVSVAASAAVSSSTASFRRSDAEVGDKDE